MDTLLHLMYEDINNIDSFVVLLSWQGHCESSPGSFDECRLGVRWPPTLKPATDVVFVLW